MRIICLVLLMVLGAGAPGPTQAEEPAAAPSDTEPPPTREEFHRLQEQVDQLQQRRDQPYNAPAAQPPPQGNSWWSSMNPKLSVDGLFAAGTSSVPDVGEIEIGGHDPNQRGVTVQNVELVLGASVDPYFTANVNVVFQLNQHNETDVELEEAYLTSTSLPWNLQLKGGQFFVPFGRLNPTHPHVWDFIDVPLVNGRLLGPDGLRGPGLQLSYLLPTPFYAEAMVAVQDGSGDTAYSFRYSPGNVLFGRTIIDRQINGIGDLLYVPRLVSSVDLTDTQTVVMGISGAFGPNGSAGDTRTAIYGVDLFYKWKPLTAEAGWPFVGWQTELMLRHYQAGPVSGATPLPSQLLRDYGGYTQALWGLVRRWVAGLRIDYVNGSGGDPGSDPDRERRFRVSPDVTFYPSEFSKWRLQYNMDAIQSRASLVHSVYLQWEFLIGEHGAHKF